LRTGEAPLYEQRIEAISELSLFALQDTRLAPLFERAVSLPARLMDVDHACIVARERSDTLKVEARAGMSDELFLRARATLLAQATHTLFIGQPVLCEDLAGESRFPTGQPFDAGMRSTVSVPIFGRTSMFGVLVVGAQQHTTYTGGDIRFLQGVARVLTSAIERERLETANAELEMLVQLSSEALLGVTLDGLITHWNAAAEALLGYSAAEIIGQDLNVFLPADRATEPAEILLRLEANEHVTGYETLRLTKQGRVVPVSLNVSPVRDAMGTLIGAAISARNLTIDEQEEEVQALGRLSNAVSGVLEPGRLYQIILEQAAILVQCDHAILVLYLDGWAVIAACWGEPSLPVGSQFYPLTEPDRPWHPTSVTAPSYLPDTALEPAWRHIPPWVGQHQIRSLISAPLIVEGELVGSFDIGSNTPSRYTDRDLRLATVFAERVAQSLRNARRFEAEQRRAEQLASLQDLTAGLSSAHTAADVARVVLGHGCKMLGAAVGLVRLISADGAWLEVLQSIGPEPVGMSLDERVAIDAAFASTDAARTGRAVWIRSAAEWQRLYPASAGPYLACGQVSAAALPLRAGSRIIGSLVLTFPEPHSFSIADRNFMQSLAELTTKALERARHYEAEQERARLAEEMARLSQEQALEAEALARLSSELVATVSHELRNPINTIIGFAEILKTTLPGGDADSPVAQLNMIVSAASRQQRLVKDLLQMSKLDLGVLATESHVLDVERHVRQAVTELHGSYPTQRVDMRGPRELRSIGDGGRVLQILINLLDNAVKYSPEDSPIEVTWQAEGSMAAFRVTNYGPGVPLAGRERLFTRFGKLAGTKARAGRGGSGLGLYLSRRFAEVMGGTLDLEATGAEGSTFRLRLPLALS
jgi:PAS domain S-box-containing protein